MAAAVETPAAPLSPAELESAVRSGEIDTVLVGMVDMQGRLQGKRYVASTFLEHVVEAGTNGCAYLLAVDVEMTPVDGYGFASWDNGYGDFLLRPDLGTLRRIPWEPGAALCLADPEWADGAPVRVSPREVLRGQLRRCEERGWTVVAASELEFLLFETSYEEAGAADFRALARAGRHNGDYSLLATTGIEPLLRRIRNEMVGAGIPVEASKGECNRGQHEITLRHGPALVACDNHVVYKAGVKEIAAQSGRSATFMAKFDEAEGNSSHVHLSLGDADGGPVFADVATMESFIAGQIAYLDELTPFLAPNVNSYKRFTEGSFAPTALAWGRDNRTCGLRIVGDGASTRVENRIPGGDVNPYLAVAAILAAGLAGIEENLRPPPPTAGNAYHDDVRRLPGDLAAARERMFASTVAREALGDDVVEHYCHAAAVEIAAFGAAVTDWERQRGFERL